MSKKVSKNIPAERQTAEAAIVEAAEKLGTFLSNVFGEPVSTSIGMLQDKLSVVRWERQLRLADRVREITNERSLSGKPVGVPPRLAVPVIENAALEEDNQLQDLWAHLLASAMNSETAPKVRNAFVDIIKQLEAIDVKILEFCYKKYYETRVERKAKYGDKSWFREADSIDYSISQKSITDALDISREIFKESIDNLMRVRLITSYIEDNEIQAEVHGSEEYYEASLHYGYHSVCITELGVAFVKVCTPSTDDEDEEELLERLREIQAIEEQQRKSAVKAALKKIEEQFGKGAVVTTKENDKKP